MTRALKARFAPSLLFSLTLPSNPLAATFRWSAGGG